jgi:predicted TIM-barrel fold metal-dependent hydrolase
VNAGVKFDVGIVDAHTHAFSPDLIKKRDVVVEQDFWFGTLYRNPLAHAVDAIAVRESSDRTGITSTLLCGFPWSDEGRCREENAYLADVAAASDGALSWLGTVVPGDENAAHDASWCLDQGALGIGELNADGQSAPLSESRSWDPLVEVMTARAKPIMIHASEPIGHDYPGKGSATPERLVEWLSCYPDLDVVLAHWGGGLPFYELMPEVHAVTRRVSYDCAASTYLYTFEVFPRVIDLAGADRVIWGSDFPVLKQGPFLRKTVAALRSADEQRAVLSGNAMRIYGMKHERVEQS